MKNSNSLFKERSRACVDIMDRKKIDLLVLPPGSNMYYLTGFHEEQWERFLVALFPRNRAPLFIVPEIYEDQVKSSTWISDIRIWHESDDPLVILEKVLSDLCLMGGTIAMDTRLWAKFFLMFLRLAPKAHYIESYEIMDEMRMKKSPLEINLLEKASSIADRVMKKAISECKVGAKEKDIALLIECETRRIGGEATSFKPIVGSGPHSALPHYRFGNRKFESGDSIVIDFGALYKGYCSDMTRTVFVEHCTKRKMKVYEVVKKAQQEAFEAVRCGIEARQVDRVARNCIHKKGYGEQFFHRTGHGIGLEVHEKPYIVEGNSRRLENGMAFSIEPGIYFANDFGVRIEDVVTLEECKGRRLNLYPRELIVV